MESAASADTSPDANVDACKDMECVALVDGAGGFQSINAAFEDADAVASPPRHAAGLGDDRRILALSLSLSLTHTHTHTLRTSRVFTMVSLLTFLLI